MTVITAKRAGRICVWPDYSIAREADLDGPSGSLPKRTCSLTVWPTNQQAAENITHDTEGGNAPEWVPENAVIHIDFLNDRAWTEADGEVGIDTLVGSDPNTVNAWSSTEYDQEHLTEDGYVIGSDIPFAMIGAARTLMVTGATTRIKFKQLEASFSSIAIATVAADGNDAIEIDLGNAPLKVNAESWSGNMGLLTLRNIETLNSGAGSVNVIAFTMVTDRLDAAVNDVAVDTTAVDATDRPPGNPLVAWLVDAADQAIQTITIYDPLPSTAGLSELSEA